MGKKELANILSELLVPIGFKKKGNYWVKNGNVITKMVNLQKSNYSNAFYINYGYILNSIPLGELMMHVYNRVTALDVEERDAIKFLLNFESNISDKERIRALKEMLSNKLIAQVKMVNTEEDLSAELKKRSQLNDIPQAVKQYLGLVEF